MKYSMKRIFCNLCGNWLLYMVIAVHFMLGAGLFIICMNFRMTSRELLSESKRQSMESLIPVVEINGRSEYGYSISYDTYLRLSTDETYEDLEMLFAEVFWGGFFYYKSEEEAMARNLTVHFMNDSLFDQLYQVPRREGVVYVGEEAYDTLVTAAEMSKVKEEFQFFFFKGEEMYIEGESLFMTGKEYPYEVVGDTVMPCSNDPGDMYSMKYAVIFPLEDVYDTMPYDHEGWNPCQSVLIYRYRNEEWREDLVARQLREINAATSSTGYFTVQDAYKELKRQLDDFRYDMDRWLLVSVSVLMLAGVGCMGSMFLLLNKRRHLIAVSVACGSTMRRIKAETIAENFIVLLSGGLLGILISPLLKKLVIYQGELRLNLAGIGIVFGAAFLFSVIAVLAGMHEIKAKNVAAALKADG